MIKKFTLFAASIALCAASVSAEDLIIYTNHSSGVEIMNAAQFNRASNYIGFAGADTQVYLGEVDFGADGNNFQASGIVLANGWYVDGYAILHAGEDYESSLPFTQMMINETGGYDNFRTFAGNMGYNASSPEELSGGIAAIEGLTYTKPIGKQKVYLTFIGGAGNIRSVNFYENKLVPSDFDQNEESSDYMLRLLEPNEKPGYYDNTIALPTANSTKYAGFDPESDAPRFDENKDPLQWGWTSDGFVASYGNVDFGTGGYEQIVLRLTHGNENIYDYLNVYLDEVKPENQIARIWTGRNLGGNAVVALAKNLQTNITGQHLVLVEWDGGSTNLEAVEFCKGKPWIECTDCGIILEDVEPSDQAFHFTFVGCQEGLGDPWGYELLARGQWENAGNIGYTGPGTVIDFYGEGEGVDFGDGSYKRIIINHSSEPAWIGDVDVSNFSFYIDLDPDFMYTKEQWEQELPTILNGHDPIAVVRLQGTGAWSERRRTAGKILREVKGLHELYMVYNTPDNNTGANVFDIWLDPVEETSGITIVDKPAEGVEVYSAASEIIVAAENDATVSIYNANGATIAADQIKAGETSYNVAPGFYIVKVETENGASAFKVIVK